MRWGGAVAGVLLIGVAVLLVTGWTPWFWASQVPWPRVSQEQRAEIDAAVVRLDLGSGDVTVRSGPAERVGLAARTRSWWGEPDQGWRRDGEVLVLGDCGWGCSVDYELTVPSGTRVDGGTGSGSVVIDGAGTVHVESGSGSIDVRNVTGAATVETGSGSIDISHVAGAVSASTGSGSVSLAHIGGSSTAHSSSGSIAGRALAGPVDADTSSGDVTLDLTRRHDVRAETSSGDVELTVPDGNYRIDAHSDGSDDAEQIEVVDDPDARYSLQLSTSSGTISVRPRGTR